MRQAEARAAQAYIDALDKTPQSDGDIESKRRAWERIIESLRKLEKDSPSIMAATGAALPREKTLQVISKFMGF